MEILKEIVRNAHQRSVIPEPGPEPMLGLPDLTAMRRGSDAPPEDLAIGAGGSRGGVPSCADILDCDGGGGSLTGVTARGLTGTGGSEGGGLGRPDCRPGGAAGGGGMTPKQENMIIKLN